MPRPPQPTVDAGPHGELITPPGWDSVIADDDGTVLAGWDSSGQFHAYAPTERIARALIEVIEQITNTQEGS